jgi:ABC-type polysaccharide/polyol phosphate transport system ATPase subunit
MPAVIRVDHVTKVYKKTAKQRQFQTLKSLLIGGNPFSGFRSYEKFKALDDVSFDVEQGEMVGIIGSNGSGKSTLLKMLVGTTKPTSGRIRTKGKISALIELGAGFHPEISGRENVYINGIMLGLSKKEISARFDDIVRFAELEDFIESPVKKYSYGMYMRLGFSVAIHVNPDILLIDEVLAVGDEAFVHKCIERIKDFKARKKTIVIVTHSLYLAETLCDRAVWIEKGKVVSSGDTGRVVDAYRRDVAQRETAGR